jgi:hypothetical protein
MEKPKNQKSTYAVPPKESGPHSVRSAERVRETWKETKRRSAMVSM